MSNDKFYAYGSARAGVEAVMRLHSVKRWHMIDTTRVQTLAEHSANVALLAYYIARTCPRMYFGPAQAVAVCALTHDLPEVFTGDIPTHTKPALSGLAELEEQIVPREFRNAASHDMTTLVKICDLADGIRFIRLHGVDVTAKHARAGLEAQMEKLLVSVLVSLGWPSDVVGYVIDICNFYATEE